MEGEDGLVSYLRQHIAVSYGSQPVPWFPQPMPAYLGPFRINVRSFLDEYSVVAGTSPDPSARVTLQTVQLQSQKGPLEMRVYVETVEDEATAYCDHCRCIGGSEATTDSKAPRKNRKLIK